MENTFYNPRYINNAFLAEQNKPIDSYAFQEKFFLDGYGITQPMPISPPLPLISPSNNNLDQQASPENQAKQSNNVFYKEDIRESVQKIFLEILLLAAVYRYYKSPHYFQPGLYRAPHHSHKDQIHNNELHRSPFGFETENPQTHSYNELSPPSAQTNLYSLYKWLGHDVKTFTHIEGNNIIAQARQNIGKPVWAFTRFASVCESGNLGCAATVSELLQDAGVKIAGSASVVGVITQLSNLGWQQIKISDKSQFHSGDIVFGLNSPHAHIGIITQANNGTVLVCDNSSSSGTLKERTIEAGGSFTPNGRFARHLYVMRQT